MLVGVPTEEPRTDQRPALEVEELVDLADSRTLQRRGVAVGPRVHGQRERSDGGDLLMGLVGLDDDPGAERLVAMDDQLEAAAERLDVERAVEPRRQRDVV